MSRKNRKSFLQIPEIEVSYTLTTNPSERIKITRSEEAFDLFKTCWSNRIGIQEEFYILYLNKKNRALGISMISRGTNGSCAIDIKLAFGIALKTSTTSMILAHNHPSGELYPSKQDIELTKKFIEAAQIFELQIVDHIILGPQGQYLSFLEHGYL